MTRVVKIKQKEQWTSTKMPGVEKFEMKMKEPSRLKDPLTFEQDLLNKNNVSFFSLKTFKKKKLNKKEIKFMSKPWTISAMKVSIDIKKNFI